MRPPEAQLDHAHGRARVGPGVDELARVAATRVHVSHAGIDSAAAEVGEIDGNGSAGACATTSAGAAAIVGATTGAAASPGASSAVQETTKGSTVSGSRRMRVLWPRTATGCESSPAGGPWHGFHASTFANIP